MIVEPMRAGARLTFIRVAVLSLSVLLPALATAQQTPTVADVALVEGNAGSQAMVFTISVPQPTPTDLAIYYVATDSGSASSSDYSSEGIYGLTIPAGQSSTTYTVQVHGDTTPEEDEWFTVELKDGALVTFASARGTIVNDDGPTDIRFYGLPDRYTRYENDPEARLDVLANDVRLADSLLGGRLEIVTPPAHGTVQVDDGGSPGHAGDDALVYRANADWSGLDALVYRACDGTGACYEEMAVVRVSLGGWPSISTSGQSGRSFPFTAKPRALSNLRFAATPLVTPVAELITVDPDPRPSTPWEAGRPGTVTRFHTLPAPGDGQPAQWQVTVDFGRLQYDRIRGYVGVDTNGDGEPSADEVRCTATMNLDEEFCDFPLAHPGTGSVRYWVMLHNPGTSPREVDIHVAAVPMIASDGRLVATGPTRVEAGGELAYLVSYTDPMILDHELAVGYVRVLRGEQEVDRLPVNVYVDYEPETNSGGALANGRPYTMRLRPEQAHNRLFIDVPAGSSALQVDLRSATNVDLYLAKGTPPAAQAAIGSAPPRAQALASGEGPGGDETLRVSGATLTPGRWYVTPVNRGSGVATATITATITNVAAPVVRPGSYFNPARGGHGIFLYPAGDQWAGLWYTYATPGHPTWYYAQAPRPGADGIWRAPLFNSVWTGIGNRLTQIGHVTLTPTGPDAFTFTHEVHGLTGSEPMAALGRGCPGLGGLPVDASSHWFDPTRAGSGFSVQFWPQYEYYAAFVYDTRGAARFLAAEKAFAGDADATLVLQQLRGTPPTSAWQGNPQRFDVGSLRRVISGGKLVRIDVTAAFTDGVPGTWTSNNAVQLLGGAGTTQGCAP